MNSIHVFPVRAAISLAVLLATLSVAPASAQGPGFAVAVERNGQRLTPREVALYAASGTKAGTLAQSNIATFAADVITASLEGKSVTALVDDCDDGSVSLHLVQDDASVQARPPERNCRRRRVGAFIIRQGSTIVVDAGRGAVADSSSATASGGRRLGIDAFGGVSGAWGGFNLGERAGDVIGTRFTAANYQRYNVDVDDSTSGLAFGGGLNIALGASGLGARLGLLRENERDVPRQSVDGSRTLGGLQFQQIGTSIVRAWTLYAGPTMRLPLGVMLSVGPSFTFWDVELTQTAQLQAGCPTPCAVVRTDNLTEQTSGSDLGFQVSADYFPGDGWFGINFMYLRATYRDAYDPSRPLGYQPDWTDSNFFVGVSVRTPQRRR